jgi:hypothetical protein
MFRLLFTIFFICALGNVLAIKIGRGIYDITGPSVEINFMGYAVPAQRGTGIHQRLRARAFIFSDGEKRNVYVSVDGGMGSDLVNMRVVDYLSTNLGPGIYTTVNYFPPNKKSDFLLIIFYQYFFKG